MIKSLPDRKAAVDFIEENYAEELQFRTEKEKKVIDEDIFLTGSREQEYRRIDFKNGEIIEWCIPERL